MHTGTLSHGVNRAECEADHLLRSSAKVKNSCNFTFLRVLYCCTNLIMMRTMREGEGGGFLNSLLGGEQLTSVSVVTATSTVHHMSPQISFLWRRIGRKTRHLLLMLFLLSSCWCVRSPGITRII
jgi:hypothetical protein